MTSIDDLKHDLKGVSDTVLTDLDTEERLRLFIKEAAEGREERIEWLTETAPTKQYEATDLAYTDGIKRYSFTSMWAKYELQTLYQAVTERKGDRDRCMALMLLNESLSRLSRGAFEIDEYGNFDAPDHDDADYAYGKQQAPDIAHLATKYRELWEDVPAELLVDEDSRSGTTEVFPNLAASGLMTYADDYSRFDDLEIDRIPSELARAEMDLTNTLAKLYVHFHGWRIFAEEYLDVTLDELLNLTRPPEDTDIMLAPPPSMPGVDEKLCENILSLNEDYLEAYQSIREEYAERVGMEQPDPPMDLDERAEAFAQAIGEAGVERY